MALSLYVNTFSIVLKINPADINAWSRIYGSISCLRESLACYVCRKLVINPVRPLPSKCQHNICRRCIGSKTQKKSRCKWCSELKEYEENAQLRIVLQCYKKMCKFILTSGMFACWREVKVSSPMLRFVSLVYEGAGLEDNYHYKSRFSNGPLNKDLTSAVLSNDENNQSINGQRNVYDMKINDSKSARIMLNNSLKECMLSNYTDSDESSDASEFDGPAIINECLRSLKKRKSCRCGMATRNPGKLTCCGQRCPCYVEGRACISCYCRGCRNPQKNLVSSPPIHGFHSINDASPETSCADVDRESFDDTSCSDSDKDPSV